jgi:hypothetical protein
MSKKIEGAIAHLRGRDASAYRKARAAHHRASAAYDEAARMLGVDGMGPYQTLEQHMVRALKPHRIEWPNHGREVGHDVNGDDWTTSAHLYGEVWPEPKGGKYNMQARAHIPFSFTPRDGAEFLRCVAMLKAAADALTEGGL